MNNDLGSGCMGIDGVVVVSSETRGSTHFHDDLWALAFACAIGDGALGRGSGGGTTARVVLREAMAARAKAGADEQESSDTDDRESCELLPVHTARS